MGRKKIALYSICFVCLLFIGATSHSLAKTQAHHPSLNALPQIVHVLQHEKVKIKDWSIYAREAHTQTVSLEQVKKQADHLKVHYPEFNWSTKTEKMDVRFEGVKTNKRLGTSEKITLLAYPRKNAYQTYLIYVVSGTKWDEKTWKDQLSSTVQDQINQFITDNNGKIFSCASGDFGDKMDVVLSKKSERILKDLKAKPIEADQEKTFMSISAYTELWKETIQTDKKRMNVQLGLRTVDHRTTVTLGTPIITSEY
ncbi:MAG TPA: YwmB family TATA-box binding protein [Sporolactobacillaceae bacterium]|nr:YwmB family TATA-box binding protein [Sporolactobacillaceae bacterium]